MKTELPMLIAFVHPKKRAEKSLTSTLRSLATRYRGLLCVVTCDGLAHRTRMISLGLDVCPSALPPILDCPPTNLTLTLTLILTPTARPMRLCLS